MNASGTAGRFTVGRILELLGVLTIILSVVGLVTARLGVFDAPPIWMVGLLLTVLYDRATFDSPSLLVDRVPAWHVLVVLVVGLLFRLTPDAYILGGQDQGVYVNMAMHLARAGDLIPVDPIVATIADPAVRDAYLKSNYVPGGYLPGVYAPKAGLVFQFYHLFPIWMALFGDGTSATVAVYGLTVLSLLSLLFFQRLAHQVTGSAYAGLSAGLLLAVNPLHAFFSKFPVTEVPTLAFSLMSFVFLLAFWRSPENAGGQRSIVLSVAAMAMLFMTRVSGFTYLPFVLALVLSTLLFDACSARRKGILLWASAVVFAYVISVFYGLKWSAPYVHDIYDASFGAVLGQHWTGSLVALVSAALATVFAIWVLSRREDAAALLRRLALVVATLLPALAVAFALVGAYKAYRLGFTDAYASDPWLAQLFKISHNGWSSVFSTALAVSLVYLSPFVLFGFFVAAFKAKKNPMLLALMFFVLCFLGIAVILNWKVFYQPYYARYLLSEFVPYAILFVVCVWASLNKSRMRTMLGGLLLAGGLSSVALSAAQLGKSEHEGVAASLDHLTARFDSGDLVLVDRALTAPNANELKTALIFTKGLKVATVSDDDLLDNEYLMELTLPFDEGYLITQKEGSIKGFAEVEFIHFTEWAFVHGTRPPTAISLRSDSRLRLLRYVGVSSAMTRRMVFGTRRRGNSDSLMSGWSTPEPWGVWSNSESGRLSLEPLNFDKTKKSMLLVTGRIYVTPKAPSQRVTVLLDGKRVLSATISYPQTRVTLAVPPPAGVSSPRELEIQTPDAISPAQLGYSGDTRALAFGLETVELRDTGPLSKE